MKTNIFGKSLFFVLPTIVCFVFLLYNFLLSSNYEKVRSDVSKYIYQWNYDLSENIFSNKNSDFVKKVFDGLKVFPISNYKIIHKGKTILKWGSEGHCQNSIEEPLTINGLNLGTVKTCILDKSIIKMTLFSPTFILVIFIFIVLIFVVSFLTLFGYKRSLNSTISLVKDLNNDQLTSESGDKITDEIISLIRQSFDLKMNLKDTQSALDDEKEFLRAIKTVAHDIRNPIFELHQIISSLSHIPEDQRLSLVESSMNKIVETSQLLLTNLEKGYKLETIRPICVSKLAKKIIADKELLYKNIQFKVDIHKKVMAICSPISFKRVLNNIVTNSVEAIPSDRTSIISCRVAVKDDVCQITIEDNGKGIPEAHLDNVCNEDFTIGKNAGSGLGLFYVDKKAREWGGSVKITSEVGKGTTINLFLQLPKNDKKDTKKEDKSNIVRNV